MTRFDPTEILTDVSAERSLLAALTTNPELAWELDLSPELFHQEAATYLAVTSAIADKLTPGVPEDWEPAQNPEATARQLADLLHRRNLTALFEDYAKRVNSAEGDVSVLMAQFGQDASRVTGAYQESLSKSLVWASELVGDVLADARERRERCQETESAVMGLPTGIKDLDDKLCGLNQGLYLLAGAPGSGKTSLALQIAVNVARDTPVVYVTFENSPQNLLLKALCNRARLSAHRVHQGLVDLEGLEGSATKDYKDRLTRLALIEGSGDLTVADLKAQVRRAMTMHKTESCLVVVDYLQIWGKASKEFRNLGTIRERIEAMGTQLSELSRSLKIPVLVLSGRNARKLTHLALRN